METLIISLGGSTIVPDSIDTGFLARFKCIVEGYASKGNRIIIVTGGGKVCRRYIDAANAIANANDSDLDLIGIAATKLNAELVRVIFGDKAADKVINNPTLPIHTQKRIIIGSGWKPGCSSDLDAVLLAKNTKAKTLINLTNVSYVYSDDPKTNPDAKPLKEISWDHMKKLVGTRWVPGKNVPFDPKATALAAKLSLKVLIMQGLDNLEQCLAGEGFDGTQIG